MDRGHGRGLARRDRIGRLDLGRPLLARAAVRYVPTGDVRERGRLGARAGTLSRTDDRPRRYDRRDDGVLGLVDEWTRGAGLARWPTAPTPPALRGSAPA